MNPKKQSFPMILIVFLITSFLISSAILRRGFSRDRRRITDVADLVYGLTEVWATSFLSAWL
jgi:hypothetical protein